eukprot:symbB.v1.2.009836.t1/scaffold635.1/size178188/7
MSTAAGCQLEEAFLLKVLRQVVDQHILQKDEVQDDLERHLEALWDLSVEAQAAEIIQQFQGIKIFAQAAERLDFKGHLAEIFLGILANVSTHFRPETETPQSEDFTIAFKALRSSDGLVLVQALRISCSLLCAKMLLSHFWSPAAIDCYIFALEHSLPLMGFARISPTNSASSLLLNDGFKEVLDVNAMVGMIFFEVAGGPYGAEPVVRKGGVCFLPG